MELCCEGKAGKIGYRLPVARVLLSISRVNRHKVRERKDPIRPGRVCIWLPDATSLVVRMHNVTWDFLDTIHKRCGFGNIVVP